MKISFKILLKRNQNIIGTLLIIKNNFIIINIYQFILNLKQIFIKYSIGVN